MMKLSTLPSTIAALTLVLTALAAAPGRAQEAKPAAAKSTAPGPAGRATARKPAGGKTAPTKAAPDLVALLEAWVRMPPGARDRSDKLEYLRHWLGAPMLRDQMALIAQDTTEPALARASALIAIGEEHPTNLTPFALAVDDPDPTVRAGAAAALRPVLFDPAREAEARALLRQALRDRVPAVANRALESLGDRDAEALREFLASAPRPELAGIARQLLTLAENRGAPLVPRDSSGTLERDAAGVTLQFVPDGRWPQWDAAQGRLTARRADGAPVVLATDVEVVRNVIPATVSGDGRYVAYESARHIHVRDLQTGGDRDLGEGIAPRVAPLAPGFLYFRTAKTTAERDRFAIDYRVVYAPYGEGASRELTGVAASARQAVSGNASPVRWARIVEGERAFLIAGEGLTAPVTLPDLAAAR